MSTDEPSIAIEPAHIAPLICPHCGAPVALGTFADTTPDTAKCIACNTEGAIAPEYAAIRATARAAESDRKEAQDLAKHLVSPPGPMMRAWMTVSNVAIVVLMLLLFVWLIVGMVMCLGIL